MLCSLFKVGTILYFKSLIFVSHVVGVADDVRSGQDVPPLFEPLEARDSVHA